MQAGFTENIIYSESFFALKIKVVKNTKNETSLTNLGLNLYWCTIL